MKQLTLAAAITLLASPLLAGQCPADIAAIDAALAAGDHDASVETLAEAKAMLGI
ncbi:hypothetical protein [Phaeobacter inhibens]|uniref:Uncharacterized protein n=1 Tax=Phaeobacter inhibens TaxID=221822 RepID=A0A2I7KAW3_9RHOB|nr:hypothetical protein [Phaeobacter inhibens]AUQ99739.1 hypothetical protein PhaeoP88_02384 [Phaeobacter inhibens]